MRKASDDNWVAICYFCTVAHAEWEQGDIWECQRCGFHCPAWNIRWWCPLEKETRTTVQEYAQTQMFGAHPAPPEGNLK